MFAVSQGRLAPLVIQHIFLNMPTTYLLFYKNLLIFVETLCVFKVEHFCVLILRANPKSALRVTEEKRRTFD